MAGRESMEFGKAWRSMDAELLELQKLFEVVQETKATVRLSERNVVELVSKLQEMQLLDSDLLHTVTGKEYVTKDRLKLEVENEVRRLGRASLVDLAATVGVELFHCERVAEQIAAGDSGISIVQGEIIADTYWDGVAEEVNEALQEAGQISVGELAKRYNVGAELLTRALKTCIGNSEIQGKLEGGQLYTPAFVSRISAMVRGAIRALTVPTPLSEVRSSLQRELSDTDDGSGGVSGLFQSILPGVVTAGEVKGFLRGGGLSWIPAVFAQSQKESVDSFFAQNGYIDYDFLRKLLISQPKSYLMESYPDGVALETVFVHTSLISVLDAAAEEALNAGGWIDVLPLVPPSFSGSDVALVVNMCSSVTKAQKESTGVVLAETCVVSLRFIKTLGERLEAEVSTLATNAVERETLINTEKLESDACSNVGGASSSNNVLSAKKDREGEGVSMQAKNLKKKRGQNSVKEKLNDIEEDLGGKGAKGRKRSGKNKGGISLLVGESGTGLSKVSKGSSTKEDADVLSLEQLADKILNWYPDMETAGNDVETDNFEETGVLAKSLANWVRPALLSIWTATKHAHYSASSEDRRRRTDNLQRKLDEVYSNLHLFERGVDLFQEDLVTSTILQRHLLRTTAAEMVDLFLAAQNREQKLEMSDDTGKPESSFAPGTLTSVERISLAKSIPGGTLSSKSVELVEALEGKSIETFESALEAALTECGMRLKKPDKKQERSLLHFHRKVLTSEVENETDPVALLPKIVALLFIQVHNRALQAPGRAMAAAVARLKNGLSDTNHKTLSEYHGLTVQLLSLQATAVPNEYDCANDRLRTKRDVLVERIPSLKSIAISKEGSLKL